MTVTVKCKFCDQQWPMQSGGDLAGILLASLIMQHLSLDHPEKHQELMKRQKEILLEYVTYEKND